MGWTLASIASGVVPTEGPCAPCYFSTAGYDIQSYPSPVSIIATATLIPLATYLPNGSLQITGTSTVIVPPPNNTALHSANAGNLTVTHADDLTWTDAAGLKLTYPTTYVSYSGLKRADGQQPVAGCTPFDIFTTPAIAAASISIVPNINVSVPGYIWSQLSTLVTTQVATPWTDSSELTPSPSASDAVATASTSLATGFLGITTYVPTLIIPSLTVPTSEVTTLYTLSLTVPTLEPSNLDMLSLTVSILEISTLDIPTIVLPTSVVLTSSTPTIDLLSLSIPPIPSVFLSSSLPFLSLGSNHIDTSSFVITTTSTSISLASSTSLSTSGNLRRQAFPLLITSSVETSAESSWQSPTACPPDTTVSSPGPFQVPDFTCSMPSQTYNVGFPSPVDVQLLLPSISQQQLVYIPPLSLLQYLDTLPSIKNEFNNLPLESCSMLLPMFGDESGTMYYFITVVTTCATLYQTDIICSPSTFTTSVPDIDSGAPRTGSLSVGIGGGASPITATLLTAVTAIPSTAELRVAPTNTGDHATSYSPGATAAPILAPTSTYPSSQTQIAQSSQAALPTGLGTPEPESVEIGSQATNDALLTRLVSLARVHSSQESGPGADEPSGQQQTVDTHGQQEESEISAIAKTTIIIQDDQQTFVALPGASSIPVARLGGAVFVGSQTLEPEHVLTVGGQVISLTTDGPRYVLAAELQTTTAGSPLTLASMPTLATQRGEIDVFRSGGAIIVNGQTLPTGSPTTMAGRVISQLSDGSGFVIDGSMTSVITVSDGQHTRVELGVAPSTMNVVLSHSGTSFMVGRSTLLPGNTIISAGQTISLDHAGSTAFVNGQPVPTSDTLFTVAATVYQPLSSSRSAVQTSMTNVAGRSSSGSSDVVAASTAAFEPSTGGGARTSTFESTLGLLIIAAVIMIMVLAM